jgi:hypothetical protein
MARKPRVVRVEESQPDNYAEWSRVLAHRTESDRLIAARRLAGNGLSPADVHGVLADGGDKLYAAAIGSPRDGWAEPFGGPLAVALLAQEVSSYTQHLTSRAAGMRSVAVSDLLQDYSAVTVAGHLGVSRQMVYEIARGGLLATFIQRIWRPL